jgi:hypothetical protein
VAHVIDYSCSPAGQRAYTMKCSKDKCCRRHQPSDVYASSVPGGFIVTLLLPPADCLPAARCQPAVQRRCRPRRLPLCRVTLLPPASALLWRHGSSCCCGGCGCSCGYCRRLLCLHRRGGILLPFICMCLPPCPRRPTCCILRAGRCTAYCTACCIVSCQGYLVLLIQPDVTVAHQQQIH